MSGVRCEVPGGRGGRGTTTLSRLTYHTAMVIRKFEDLRAWQQARELTRLIYKLCQKRDFVRDFGLRDQLQRAAVSTMANIAEGFDCTSRTEFKRFLGYARRSAVEIQSLLYVCRDAGYITEELFDSYYEQARIVKALTGGLMHSIT